MRWREYVSQTPQRPLHETALCHYNKQQDETRTRTTREIDKVKNLEKTKHSLKMKTLKKRARFLSTNIDLHETTIPTLREAINLWKVVPPPQILEYADQSTTTKFTRNYIPVELNDLQEHSTAKDH